MRRTSFNILINQHQQHTLWKWRCTFFIRWFENKQLSPISILIEDSWLNSHFLQLLSSSFFFEKVLIFLIWFIYCFTITVMSHVLVVILKTSRKYNTIVVLQGRTFSKSIHSLILLIEICHSVCEQSKKRTEVIWKKRSF